MRKYQPIWDAIKENKSISIKAPSANHRRIILAVRKEKTNDLGWKTLQLEEGKRYKLKETIDGNTITFELVKDDSDYIADMKL